MDVSVIMINYNTCQLAANALASIFENTENIEYEIILIDNASSDGSVSNLKDLFGQRVKFIQSDKNLGTTKAFNIGVKNSSGKYILWLNTDILIKENFIYKLFDFMERNEDCGICGGNILDFNGDPAHSFRRQLPSLKSIKGDYNIIKRRLDYFLRSKRSVEFNYTDKPMEVGYITGADMMIRRSVIEKIGGFDEDIFMYAEESEFTFRMKKLTDYKVISVPNAKIYHLEGASFNSKKREYNKKRFNFIIRGNYIYFKKCYGQKAAVKYIKIILKSYKKFAFISKLLFLKKKYELYSNQYNDVLSFYDSEILNGKDEKIIS